MFKYRLVLLYLSRDKTKEQFDKNTNLTPNKKWHKKQDHSLVDF